MSLSSRQWTQHKRTFDTRRGFLSLPMSGSGVSDTRGETSVSAPAKSTFHPRYCDGARSVSQRSARRTWASAGAHLDILHETGLDELQGPSLHVLKREIS